MKLHVIDHPPAAWFLLDEGKRGEENQEAALPDGVAVYGADTPAR